MTHQACLQCAEVPLLCKSRACNTLDHGGSLILAV